MLFGGGEGGCKVRKRRRVRWILRGSSRSLLCNRSLGFVRQDDFLVRATRRRGDVHVMSVLPARDVTR